MAQRVKCLVLFAQKCYILAYCGSGLAYPADCVCVCVCLSIFVQCWSTGAKRLSRSSRFWCEGCGYHRRQLLRESGVAHGKKDLPRGMMLDLKHFRLSLRHRGPSLLSSRLYLWSPYGIGQTIIFSSFSFFYSSPNLSGRRLDVYHTSTHGVALVRI